MMRVICTAGLSVIALLAPPLQDRSALMAFRVDDQRVVASVRELLDPIPQFKEGQGTQTAAKYGYPFLDLPEALRMRVPPEIKVGDRWAVHTAPGQVFQATAERFVLGQGQCSSMLGLVLRIDDQDATAFAGVRTKYYVADTRSAGSGGTESTLGPLPMSTITPEVRARLEASLAQVFALELPRVRAETAKSIVAMAASDVGYHRAWARDRQNVEAALARGAGVLAYDAQPFRLTPDGVPHVFVRAQWRVGSRPGFAASFWIRWDTGAIVWKNVNPASWLRMFEFQGEIDTTQLGLVLNVIDRDRNGWAELIFLQAGYESIGVSLYTISSSGFTPAGISYAYGC